jgi:hypothetical protein
LAVDTLGGGASVRALPELTSLDSVEGEDIHRYDLSHHKQVTLLTRRNASTPPEIEAEQLLWVNLWRGGAVLEGRWRFSAAEGTLDIVQVDIEGDFELISAAALSPASVNWAPGSGKSSVTWSPREHVQELVVEAMFLWRGSSARERVLPRIEPLSTTVSRRWLAVDKAPHSDLTLVPPPANDIIDVDQFATLWSAEEPPQAARRLTQPGPVLVATPLSESNLQYSASTSCYIQRELTQWEFRANLARHEPPSSLLAVTIPVGSRNLSVEIGAAGQQQAISWLDSKRGEILLLPTDAIGEGRTVVLRGELPSQQRQTFTVPSIRGAIATSHLLDLSRQSDVRATVTNHTELVRRELPGRLPRGIPVARFGVDSSADQPASVTWNARPNRPRTAGTLVTTLRHQNDQWIARLDAFLEVRNGVVDTFRLEAPASWTGLTLIDGDAEFETAVAAGGNQQVRVKPTGGLSGPGHVAIEAPLAEDQAGRIVVPPIHLLGTETVQQFVRLPLGSEYSWSTTGVQEAALPENLLLADDGSVATYRAAVPQFHVELVDNASVKQSPAVAWSDVSFEARSTGSYVARASFAIVPAGEIAMPLALPKNARLLRAEVEGEPVLVELKGQQRFDVPLHSSQLPQWVDVLYTGPTLRTADDVTPKLAPWQLETPIRTHSESHPAPELPAREVVELLSPVLDHPTAKESLPADWAAAWLSRMETATSDSADASLRYQSRRLAAQLREVIDESAESDGGAQRLPVAYEQSELPPQGAGRGALALSWLIAVLIWIGLVVLVAWLRGSAVVAEIEWRWPALPAVVAGAVIALLIAPPWIGILLMLVGGVSALLWPWRLSTIVR